ncbi:glycosyltransferase family 2 protein [Dysgonomonas sp. 216]|uniref:glycosyltransferase family 2 protein n=1 Tax=Dysgonomonas sp. 216 TaxID=2302934 RepID=UPI0013D46CC6|nr:glycosyltransferase family 2 protein [Dysgonomonas sp. 216]NDW17853.1 glycosyltransferase family 2 protein [Dysgonomonas sp. 216]
MKLSVIIVNYNVKYFLEQCLLSVEESNFPFEYEVFVVDNNSSDNSIAYLSEKFPNVFFIANSDNPGFAKANNQCIKVSKGEYILLLNPDTVVGENVFSNVCDFADKNPIAGAIGVKMINGYGEFLAESKRGFPTPWASFCKIFGLTKLFPNSTFFGRYHLKYLDENSIHRVDVLAGAFMLLRRSALNKSGLLDEDFFMYGEDIDLSYRIMKAGYENYYLPEKIIHYKGESTKKDIKYVKVFYQAMHIFFKKHYPHFGKIYSLFITSGIYARAAVAAMKRIITAVFNIKKTKKGLNVVLLDHSSLSYSQIINKMDKEKRKNTEYRIYSPKSGMIIGSNFAEKANNDAEQ